MDVSSLSNTERPEGESPAKPCWVLVEPSGRPYDNGDGIPHFDDREDAEKAAAEENLPYEASEEPRPCLVVKCVHCEYVFDEDEWTTHFDNAEVADELMRNTDWVRHESGWCCGGCDCEDDETPEAAK